MQKSATLLLTLSLVVMLLESTTALHCWATGDPHYSSFFGKRFDVYNTQGDHILAEYGPANFMVQTRMKFQHPWANRALQTDVVVEIDGNRIESRGGREQYNPLRSLTVNGARKNAPFGNTQLKNGVIIRAANRGHYMHMDIISPKHKINMVIDVVRHQKFAYHNIYITVPNAWKSQMKNKGLCGHTKSTGVIGNSQTKADRPQKDIFHRAYVPSSKVPHRLDHVKWESMRMKKKAERHCTEKGLREELWKDCVYDIKLAKGDVKAAEGYNNAEADIRELMKIGQANGDGYLHAIYVTVNKMKKVVIDDINKAVEVHNDLAKQKEQLQKDLDTAKLMLATSAKFSNSGHRSVLAGHINKLKMVVSMQKAGIEKDLQKQKKLIDDGKKELNFVRKVLGFVGDMIMEKRK